MKPFNLWRPINPRMSMHRTDVRNTGKALRFLGFSKGAEDKETDEPEEAVIDSLRRFQRQFGLKVDGVMYPNGPTHRRMKEMLSETARGTSDRTSIVSSEHDDARRLAGPARPTLLGSRRGQALDEARIFDFPNNAGEGQPDNGEGAPADREETSSQVAFAAPAARFAIWLMQRYGAPTIAAAKAMYESWTKKRQDSAFKDFEDDDDAQYDRCEQRYNWELARCARWKGDEVRKCKDRAKIRFDLCYRRVPLDQQPGEWSEKDME